MQSDHTQRRHRPFSNAGLHILPGLTTQLHLPASCFTHTFSHTAPPLLPAQPHLSGASIPAISLNRTPRTGFWFFTFLLVIQTRMSLKHYTQYTFTITLFNSVHCHLLQVCLLFVCFKKVLNLPLLQGHYHHPRPGHPQPSPKAFQELPSSTPLFTQLISRRLIFPKHYSVCPLKPVSISCIYVLL